MSSKDTYEESADMLNEIYRFGISPDTVHHLAGEVASRVNMVKIIPSPEELRKIVEQISSKQHRKPPRPQNLWVAGTCCPAPFAIFRRRGVEAQICS